MNVEAVRRALDALGVSYALIGAHAMAARGYPRFTVDIDLLATDSRVLDRATWTTLEREGAAVDVRGGADDPLGGVVHILLSDGTGVDVVLGRWKWEGGVIERSQRLQISPGVTLPVPTLSDLILLKLAAGGFLDLHDAAALLEVGERATLEAEVESRIADVRPDICAAWRDLLTLSLRPLSAGCRRWMSVAAAQADLIQEARAQTAISTEFGARALTNQMDLVRKNLLWPGFRRRPTAVTSEAGDVLDGGALHARGRISHRGDARLGTIGDLRGV